MANTKIEATNKEGKTIALFFNSKTGKATSATWSKLSSDNFEITQDGVGAGLFTDDRPYDDFEIKGLNVRKFYPSWTREGDAYLCQ